MIYVIKPLLKTNADVDYTNIRTTNSYESLFQVKKNQKCS